MWQSELKAIYLNPIKTVSALLVKAVIERLDSLQNEIGCSLCTSSELSKQSGSFDKDICHET